MPSTFVTGIDPGGPRELPLEIVDAYLAVDGPLEEDGRRFDLLALPELEEVGHPLPRPGDPVWVVAKLSTPSRRCRPRVVEATVHGAGLSSDVLPELAFEPFEGRSIRFEWRRHEDAEALRRHGYWRARWVLDGDEARWARAVGRDATDGEAAWEVAREVERREVARILERVAADRVEEANGAPDSPAARGGRADLARRLVRVTGEDPFRFDGPGCPWAVDEGHRGAGVVDEEGPVRPCPVCGSFPDLGEEGPGRTVLDVLAAGSRPAGRLGRYELALAIVREWLEETGAGDAARAVLGVLGESGRRRVRSLAGAPEGDERSEGGPVAVRVGLTATGPEGEPRALPGTEVWTRAAELDPGPAAAGALRAAVRVAPALGTAAAALRTAAGASYLKLPATILLGEVGLLRACRRGIEGRFHPLADPSYPWGEILSGAGLPPDLGLPGSVDELLEGLEPPAREELEGILQRLSRPPVGLAVPDEEELPADARRISPSSVALSVGMPDSVEELAGLEGVDARIVLEAVRAMGGPDLPGPPGEGARTDVGLVLGTRRLEEGGPPRAGRVLEGFSPASMIDPEAPLLGLVGGDEEAWPVRPEVQDRVRGDLGIVEVSLRGVPDPVRPVLLELRVDTASDPGPTATAVHGRIRRVADAIDPDRLAIRLRSARYLEDVLELPEEVLRRPGIPRRRTVPEWLEGTSAAVTTLREALRVLEASGALVDRSP